VSTLDALFSGRKELFEGLFIYDKWDWTKKYPVIRLDFGGLAFKTPDELEQSLAFFVKSTAKRYNVSLSDAPYKVQFGELIENLHDSTGEQVVVLVDEYDKPIIDHLSNKEKLKANKDILHDFYPALKAADDHIQFIFLTGVSKFSGLSIFSALNNPSDITLNRKYSTICGYTQEELEYYFTDYIDEIAECERMSRNELLEAIKFWYNGYSWDGETSVYNPFSTLLMFDNSKIDNYWFHSGTPTFLMDLLKSRNQIQPVLEPFQVSSSVFVSYDPENIAEIPLLFQTGYLTIKQQVKLSFTSIQYILGTPNEEVKVSFLEYLLNAYTEYPLYQIRELAENMQKQLYNGDTSALEQNLRLLIANIPNILHIEKEAYYHSMFLLLMNVLGFDIHGEIQTNIGRIDVVWQQADLTVVGEVKYSAEGDIDKLLKKAMKQIYKRKYYEAFLDRKVMLMAVAFRGKEVKCELKNIKTIKN
jgi:hypothetical protein